MVFKTYDQLQPATQRVIDARIYLTEFDRMVNRLEWFDGREAFVGDTPALVNHLREVYAADSQTSPPKHYEWQSGAAEAVRLAKKYQNEFFAAGDRVSNISDVVELLTNLPYPEKGEKLDRQR